MGYAAADGALPDVRRARGGRAGRPADRSGDGCAGFAGSGGKGGTGDSAAGPRREVRLPVPAAAGTLAALAANGLFAALSGLILATTLHQPSHALSGTALFLVFAAGVVSQLATARLQASRVLALGTISMLAGLALVVVSVRLSAPSLALFLVAGALIGAGSGAVFKGTSGIVLGASPPESGVAMTSDLLIALYVGLAVPVIGPGSRSTSAPARPTPSSASPSWSGWASSAPAAQCCVAVRNSWRRRRRNFP
jgi:MFS family permease